MANAVNAGKGYPQQVLGAAGAAGASGNQGVNTGLAVTQSGANTMGTGNTWQQLGNQGVGMWGQMLQAQNQADIGTAQANNAASSGIGSAIGGLAGLAMMAAEGGAIPDDEMAEGETGMSVPVEASPSGGAIEDDVPAQMPNGGPARLNAGEFVMPKDVVEWLGEKGMQQIILKARKEMGSPDKAPAQPEVGTPPGAPPTPPRGVGAIPELEDAA
jgi:hypothetical protein